MASRDMESSVNSLVQLIPSGSDELRKSYGTSSISKTPMKGVDAAWYVFDNLSCEQAEDLLRQHGEKGTYLVAHFLDPESYGLSIRLEEGRNVVYKHYPISIVGEDFQVEGIPGIFSSIEDIVTVIAVKVDQKLTPIFSKNNKEAHDLSITCNAEPPPAYLEAEKFPQAARKPLPIIVPIHPTLRRMGLRGPQSQLDSRSGELPEELSASSVGAIDQDYSQKGCCWKAFHTDINGKWYKPHKAGPVTAVLLVIGWILFLVFFGWIVGLALILVLILICFAYIFNFICTGRCKVEEPEEGQSPTTNNPTSRQPSGSRQGRGVV